MLLLDMRALIASSLIEEALLFSVFPDRCGDDVGSALGGVEATRLLPPPPLHLVAGGAAASEVSVSVAAGTMLNLS